ncbi:MAG: arsenical pump-driving ATPase [Betaproteobacteria bacterium]|nr:arsenical pump-driving ATPase [Betaproteobacteria bacterium]
MTSQSLPKVATRHLFFTGKGGVGKTSLACATAMRLALDGRKVLLVSTDPASNLDEVLQTPLGTSPTAVNGVPGLSALNVDPEAAAAAYRERMVGPYRGVLPEAAIRSMEEQFSGGCTVEIAAFDAFAELLGGNAITQSFDHIVFDTAPTGHTLRLLTLPSAWSEFLSSSTTGNSCLGPLAGLEKNKQLYAAAVAELADAARTTVVLVARPEASALREAERTRAELAQLGVHNQVLAVNGVFSAGSRDEVALAMASRHRQALEAMPPGLAALPRTQTGFIPRGLVGLDALRALVQPVVQGDGASVPSTATASDAALAAAIPQGLGTLVDDIERAGHGLVMTMGKGGVGKTTVAAAVAVELAARGHKVLLSTTDPAAHVSWALQETVPGLSLSRIDPVLEVERYRQEVLTKAGAGLDANGRAMLEEDLRSPCTEEIAVFHAFARTVDEGRDAFVVLDTAPTGHTILLMDSAEAYHREVMRTQGDMPEAVRQLLPRLRDPAFTRVLIVTLPEATPVHEAERLQADLRRAQIEPFAWVVNQSLLASGTQDPVLALRGHYEAPFIERVAQSCATRAALLPWQASAPVGAQALRELVQ